MSKIKSPSEKKRLSLSLDRRNSYRENSKASRKGIPLSKARAHREQRRSVTNVLLGLVTSASGQSAEAADASTRVAAKRKKVGAFKKWPDQPLSVHIEKQELRRVRRSKPG
jgi:hypothetical protein